MQKVRELSGHPAPPRLARAPRLASPSPCPEPGEACAGGAAGQPSPRGCPGRALLVWGPPPGHVLNPRCLQANPTFRLPSGPPAV